MTDDTGSDDDLEPAYEHRERARELRSEGFSLRQIAEEIPNNPSTGREYSPSTVLRWIAAPDSEVHGA